PLWFLTADPLWAVVTLTVVDLIGFGPTFRRGFSHPRDESSLFFGLAALRNLMVVLALEHYSLTTALFPAAVGIACRAFVCMLAARRHAFALPADAVSDDVL